MFKMGPDLSDIAVQGALNKAYLMYVSLRYQVSIIFYMVHNVVESGKLYSQKLERPAEDLEVINFYTI